MAVIEHIRPFDYVFGKDCRVDPGRLHDFTRLSLETTGRAYIKNREQYIRDTYGAVHYTSEDMPYAHFWNPGDSTTDAVLMYNGFGTPIAPRHSADAMTGYVEDRQATRVPNGIEPNDANKLIETRFLYDTLRQAGITDEAGDYLSVFRFPVPSLDHTSPLNKEDRAKVSDGDFTPLARRGVEVVRRAGYRRMYAAGQSLGTIAAQTVQLAGVEGIDVLAACYMADVPGFKNRHPRQPLPFGLMVPYIFDSVGYDYEGKWIADGPEPRLDIARNGEKYDVIGHWFKRGNLKANLAIGKGLSKESLTQTLEYMHDNSIPTTLSWTESRLMKGFEAQLNNDVSAERLALDGLLQLFCSKNAPHLSGENQVVQVDMVLRSILFAQDIHADRTAKN